MRILWKVEKIVPKFVRVKLEEKIYFGDSVIFRGTQDMADMHSHEKYKVQNVNPPY